MTQQPRGYPASPVFHLDVVVLGVLGLLAIVGWIPFGTPLFDLPYAGRMAAGLPLLVAGIVCWAIGAARFAQYAHASRVVRNLRCAIANDRDAEQQFGGAVFSPLATQKRELAETVAGRSGEEGRRVSRP